MMDIAPRTMSTQHPDNVHPPFFSDMEVLAGETEIREAFYAFSHLGCAEQMWDFEGKESDNHVVEKLLARHPEFFRTLPLGRDFRMTLRLPNPAVEPAQAKVLLEAMESIPRHYDIAKAAGIDVAPIYEIIIPMTTSALEIRKVMAYYRKFVVGKAGERVLEGHEQTISQWIGSFEPERINAIPLVEDKASLLAAGKIASELIEKEKLDGMRFFLARSDPALNYGSAPAVIYNKIALMRLQEVSDKLSVPIYPIIGVGSAPFRGNLQPGNVKNCMGEYPSVQTFSIQSSFKYDHPQTVVRNAIEEINSAKTRAAKHIEPEGAIALATAIEEHYIKQLSVLQPKIAALSKFMPSRRARRMHTGLFGYSRQTGGMALPRAIPFCGALYSLGIPPELLGVCSLSDKHWDMLCIYYENIEEDLADAAKYANPANFSLAGEENAKHLDDAMRRLDVDADEGHAEITAEIKSALIGGHNAAIGEKMIEAAKIRGFLG